jgi:hypothetical protein
MFWAGALLIVILALGTFLSMASDRFGQGGHVKSEVEFEAGYLVLSIANRPLAGADGPGVTLGEYLRNTEIDLEVVEATLNQARQDTWIVERKPLGRLGRLMARSDYKPKSVGVFLIRNSSLVYCKPSQSLPGDGYSKACRGPNPAFDNLKPDLSAEELAAIMARLEQQYQTQGGRVAWHALGRGDVLGVTVE